MSASPPPYSSPPSDPGALAAARERVVRLLTDRYADDSLTTAEFEARLGVLHSAGDPAALDAMARELAAPRVPTRRPAAQVVALTRTPETRLADGATADAPALAGRWPAEERILGIMSGTRRRGRWTVARRLRVYGIMSDVKIDLRNAALPESCEIEVHCVMAAVHITVPYGTDTQVDVTALVGSVDDSAASWRHVAPPGAPRIVVRGTAFMGEVKVDVAPPQVQRPR